MSLLQRKNVVGALLGVAVWIVGASGYVRADGFDTPDWVQHLDPTQPIWHHPPPPDTNWDEEPAPPKNSSPGTPLGCTAPGKRVKPGPYSQEVIDFYRKSQSGGVRPQLYSQTKAGQKGIRSSSGKQVRSARLNSHTRAKVHRTRRHPRHTASRRR